MNRLVRFVLILLVAGCASAPPELETADTSPEPEVVSAPTEPVGTVRVTASKLNVREAPHAQATVVATLRKGEKVALLETADRWHRLLLADGKSGWVSAEFVREVKGCPSDRDFRLVAPPAIAFTETDRHGVVTVEAEVSTKGEVIRTRVTSNTTGESTLASIAEKEIRSARFDAPVKNCRAQRFVYVYRKSF